MSDFNICLECNKDKQDYFGCWDCRDYGIKLGIIALLEEATTTCDIKHLAGLYQAIELIKGNNEN